MSSLHLDILNKYIFAQATESLMSLDYTNALYFINHEKDLFSIDKECLKLEITVSRNYLIQLTDKFGLKELKQILTASCKRSFSVMRRIKSWTSTTMGQERLSDFLVIHIERDIVINNEIILNKYADNTLSLNL